MATSITLDYLPRRVDVAALKQRNWDSLRELANFATYSNVALALPHLRLAGHHGWPALCTAAGQLYVDDITKNQVRDTVSTSDTN